MNEIKCPNCGTVIKIDESIYAKIVKQVRDKEFNEDLKKTRKPARNQIFIELLFQSLLKMILLN